MCLGQDRILDYLYQLLSAIPYSLSPIPSFDRSPEHYEHIISSRPLAAGLGIGSITRCDRL